MVEVVGRMWPHQWKFDNLIQGNKERCKTGDNTKLR